MRLLNYAVPALLLLAGCTDQLAVIQDSCRGRWELVRREMPDGTLYGAPAVRGEMIWKKLDARRAHVTLWVQTAVSREKLDYAASVYEISTSAITRNRHLLVRRGYRPVETVPLSVYGRARKTRGVIKLLPGLVEITHEADLQSGGGHKEAFTQVFEGDTMTASYTGAFSDTWKRVHTF